MALATNVEQSQPHARSRSTMYQFDPGVGDRRSAEGQFGASRDADGHRPDWLSTLHPLLAAQPRQSQVVRPRPLRPVGRTWLDAALQPAVPDRLRSAAGGDQTLSPTRQPYSGASRIRLCPGCGNDYRTAGTGLWHRGWDGDRSQAYAGTVRPRRQRPVRPSHLFDRQRRRHDGRDFQRGGLAGRPSAAGQHHLSLRRQPHHHRRTYRNHLHRGCLQALRRLWMAYPGGRGRQ